MTPILIITCEHAVNTIPDEYHPLFHPHEHRINSHEGFDIGALDIAEALQATFSQAHLICATASRLLIDCNRSLHHTNCFSSISKQLDTEAKHLVINEFYTPFRQQTIEYMHHYIAQNLTVLHLSIHSFTPILNNAVRNTDIGLLYDPKHKMEKNLATCWRRQIKTIAPEYRVRMNYPYKGISDGFKTFLRTQFPINSYIGLEVETNQILTENSQPLQKLIDTLRLSLLNVLKL